MTNHRLGTKRTQKLKTQLIHRDGSICHWCKHRFPRYMLTLDHVIERSEGGSNELENLVLACGPCNNERSNAPYDQDIPRLPPKAKFTTQTRGFGNARDTHLRSHVIGDRVLRDYLVSIITSQDKNGDEMGRGTAIEKMDEVKRIGNSMGS